MERTHKDILVADTSGLVSLVVPTDHNHAAAVTAAERLTAQQSDILIPSAVFYEFLNILGRQVGHVIASGTVSAFTPPFILLQDPSRLILDRALATFRAAPPAVSFTDCMVMATADEYETRQIFGFDKQFADAGYTRLTPSQEWSTST
ncbi:MAG: PIN domain-containing protein [Acidobacteria bacterium]|nr:PIN domain-containing protein [Acidobacteriota bacterium]